MYNSHMNIIQLKKLIGLNVHPAFKKINSMIEKGELIRLKRGNRAHIALAFNDLFGDNMFADDIMDQLREITTEDIFAVKNIKHSGSNWYIYPRRKDANYV